MCATARLTINLMSMETATEKLCFPNTGCSSVTEIRRNWAKTVFEGQCDPRLPNPLH